MINITIIIKIIISVFYTQLVLLPSYHQENHRSKYKLKFIMTLNSIILRAVITFSGEYLLSLTRRPLFLLISIL